MNSILAIDQGTTSTRAMLFGADGRPLKSHAIALKQYYPGNGWVEHDADEILRATQAVCRHVLKGVAASRLKAIGVTNQRETTLIWDRKTGEPIHHAITGPRGSSRLRLRGRWAGAVGMSRLSTLGPSRSRAPGCSRAGVD